MIDPPPLIYGVVTLEEWTPPAAAVDEAIDGSPLWDDPRVPKRGWTCEDVDDLGADGPGYDPGVCQMCHNESLRFIHHMIHRDYPVTVEAGCICAGHMADGYDGHAREQILKGVAERRKRWLGRNWRVSRNGNEYLNLNGYRFGVCPRGNGWNWWIIRPHRFGDGYKTRHEAKMALFEHLIEHHMI